MSHIRSASLSQDQLARFQSDVSELLDAVEEEEEAEKARCFKFRQQELWAMRPVWSPRCVVVLYYLVALIFVPVGIAVLVSSQRLSSTSRARYDNIGVCAASEADTPECIVPLTITQDTPSPSYLYYGLINFFQNQRNYIGNRADEQLRGMANPSTSGCRGAGAAINDAVPCGLVAFSFFNDTFELCRDEECSDLVAIRKEGIAWDIDVSTRFLPGEVGTDGYTEESNSLVTDQDFMVWMRLSAYNNFHKLYRIVEEDLPAGEYFVRINSNYPVDGFGGEKFIFLSETTWFGGPSDFLGIGYVVVGSLGFIMATFFAIRAKTAPDAQLPPETSIPVEGYEVTEGGYLRNKDNSKSSPRSTGSS